MNEPMQPAEAEAEAEAGAGAGADAEAMERAARIAEKAETERHLSSGASWFYWVAGLSLVNSVISLAEGGWSFLFGLGATQVVDALALAFAEQAPDNATLIRGGAFVLNLAIAGIFVLFGWLAGRRRLWAFWLGGAIYLGDALLLALLQDWLGLAFHGWVLFALFRGYMAGRQLAALEPPDDPYAAPDPYAPPASDFQGPR